MLRLIARSIHLWLFHAVLPVLTGAAIYTLWRSQKLLVFTWYRWLGLGNGISSLRADWLAEKGVLPPFFLYSLPDALWVYAFTASLVLVWRQRRRTGDQLIWFCVPTILGVGAELGQHLKLVQGTFDWADIWAYLIAGFLGTLLPSFHLALENQEESCALPANL